MQCPHCKTADTAVYCTRNLTPDLRVRYRRCNECGMTFKSWETTAAPGVRAPEPQLQGS